MPGRNQTNSDDIFWRMRDFEKRLSGLERRRRDQTAVWDVEEQAEYAAEVRSDEDENFIYVGSKSKRGRVYPRQMLPIVEWKPISITSTSWTTWALTRFEYVALDTFLTNFWFDTPSGTVAEFRVVDVFNAVKMSGTAADGQTGLAQTSWLHDYRVGLGTNGANALAGSGANLRFQAKINSGPGPFDVYMPSIEVRNRSHSSSPSTSGTFTFTTLSLPT